MRLENILKVVLYTKGIGRRWGLPLLITGKPGTAKTSRVQQFTHSVGLQMASVIASLREPADFLGLPVPNADGSVHYIPPRWARVLEKAKRGVAFFDELSTAPPAVQSALLRVIFEGAVGDLVLPAGIRFIAAQNDVKDMLGGYDLSAPLANRFVHLSDVDVDVSGWVSWLMSGGDSVERAWGNPEAIEAEVEKAWADPYARAQGTAVTFLQRKAGLLHQMPKDAQASKAWPSPRSWDLAIRAMAGAEIHHLSDEETDALLSGCIGPGAATEFGAFRRKYDLPDPAALLDGKIKFKFDAKLDRTQSVLNSCSALVCPPGAEKRLNRARALYKLMTPLAKENADVVFTAVRELCRNGLNTEKLGDDPKECLAACGPALIAAGLVKESDIEK